MVELKYPTEVTGTPWTETILALVCPSPRSAEKVVPIIGGTNASHVRRMVKHCQSGVDLTQTLDLQVCVAEPTKSALPIQGEDGKVGCLTWRGPGPLTLVPGKDWHVACKVDLTRPIEKEILMVDSSPSSTLPASVILQPMVLPGLAVNVNNFRILIRNQSLKETSIPVGTVMGCLYLTENIIAVSSSKPEPSTFDPEMINFGDSPVPQEWKERLKRKLSQRLKVFSHSEWDVGLARGMEHTIHSSGGSPTFLSAIPPPDFDDVKKHLLELLCAGITRVLQPLCLTSCKNEKEKWKDSNVY